MATEINSSYVNIIDSTLRSGEQTAGVVFSRNEKIRISKMLDEIGIPELEVGVPTISKNERDTIKEILSLKLSSKIFGYLEAIPENIDYAKECGLENIVITVFTSDGHIKAKYNNSRNVLIARLKETIKEIKKKTTQLLSQIHGNNEIEIWQNRFWEHTIKDEDDLNVHFDYIHYNPVKQGYVDNYKDWTWSSYLNYYSEANEDHKIDPASFSNHDSMFGE